MKTKLVFVFTCMMVFGAYSQCAIGVQHFFTYDSSVLTTSTRTQMSCCVWGNEYIPITNIVAGNTYTIDSCGASNNTTLTLFDPNDDEVAFSINECAGGGGLITNFVALLSGTYKAQVNTPSCGGVNANTGVYITLDATLHTEDLNANDEVHLYPNPSSEEFKVVSSIEITSISLYDIQGKLVKMFLNHLGSYSVQDLDTGIYFARIKSLKGKSFKKLIIN